MSHLLPLLLLALGCGWAQSAPTPDALPQLLNADGSLSASATSAASAAPGLAHALQRGVAQAGQQLGQAQDALGRGAQDAYLQGQQYLQQGVDEVKNAANQLGERVQQFGNEIAAGPKTFLNGLGQMNNDIQQGLDNAVKSGVDKLKELQQGLSDRFKPVVERAQQIFGGSGTEREKWNELVGQVEATNLSEPEKQELYQKIANATVPQLQTQAAPDTSSTVTPTTSGPALILQQPAQGAPTPGSSY